MKKKVKTLVLSKDTLRNLEADKLKEADGAKPPTPMTRDDSCATCLC